MNESVKTGYEKQRVRHNFVPHIFFFGGLLVGLLLLVLFGFAAWSLATVQSSNAWIIALGSGLGAFFCINMTIAGWSLLTGRKNRNALGVSYTGLGIFLLIMAGTSWIDPQLSQKTISIQSYYNGLTFMLLLGAGLVWRGIKLYSAANNGR